MNKWELEGTAHLLDELDSKQNLTQFLIFFCSIRF